MVAPTLNPDLWAALEAARAAYSHAKWARFAGRPQSVAAALRRVAEMARQAATLAEEAALAEEEGA